MQAFVKVIVALLFSHMSVSEPIKEDRKEKADFQKTMIIKKSNCASAGILTEHQLI